MKKYLSLLAIALMIIYLSNCSKGITDPSEKIQNKSNSQIQSEMENVIISVPDSIPEKINELVVKKSWSVWV
jgi:protein involved in sex pheromone biosynthesis